MSLRGGAAALILFTCGPGIDASAACLTADRDDQTAEGRLAYGRFVDFAGRKEHADTLKLTAPACPDGESEVDKVASTKRIHVFSMDARLRGKMRGLVGRSVRLRGYALGEHTVYHLAPIVMNIVAIERR